MWQFENAQVQQKKIREGKDKNGRPWSNVSLNINGTWHSLFVNKNNADVLQSLNEGDWINFNAEQKGQYSNIVDLEIAKKASPKQVAAAQAGNQEREHRIFYSGTQKSAAALVAAMIQHDKVPLSAKKANHVEEILGFTEKVTQELIAQTDRYVDAMVNPVEEEDEPETN